MGVLLTATDHLAAQHPQMVAVAAQCTGGEFFGHQMQQEGLEELDDAMSRSEIAFLI